MKAQLNKISLTTFILATLFFVSCSVQTHVYRDDVYYRPSDETNEVITQSINEPSYSEENHQLYENNEIDTINDDVKYYESEQYVDDEGNTYITNNYYYDDYYDFSYSSRIRRFDDDWDFPYYSSFYTSSYWYTYNPWDWSVSIYLGYPWWHSYYYPYHYYWYRPYYRPYYYWGSYGWGYHDGYYDGYWNGYWDGYYAGTYYNYYTPYYYNSYDQTLSSVHRRGSIGTQSSSISQSGTYQSFVDTYQRNVASKPLDSNTPTIAKPINEKPIAVKPNQISNKPSKKEKPQISSGFVPDQTLNKKPTTVSKVPQSNISKQNSVKEKPQSINIRNNKPTNIRKNNYNKQVKPSSKYPKSRNNNLKNNYKKNNLNKPSRYKYNKPAKPTRTIKYQKPQRTSNYRQYSRPSYSPNKTNSNINRSSFGSSPRSRYSSGSGRSISSPSRSYNSGSSRSSGSFGGSRSSSGSSKSSGHRR